MPDIYAAAIEEINVVLYCAVLTNFVASVILHKKLLEAQNWHKTFKWQNECQDTIFQRREIRKPNGRLLTKETPQGVRGKLQVTVRPNTEIVNHITQSEL